MRSEQIEVMRIGTIATIFRSVENEAEVAHLRMKKPSRKIDGGVAEWRSGKRTENPLSVHYRATGRLLYPRERRLLYETQ